MELPPDSIVRGVSPEGPQPEEAAHPAALNGPPLMLPTEQQEPLERASLAETRALRSEIAEMAPSGSALETVCKEMPEATAEAASRGSAAVTSGNLNFIKSK